MCKTYKFALAMCIIFLFTVINASASFDVYNLDELELKTSIPDDYLVITRDISANSQVLADLGLKKSDISDIIDQFETMGIYLNALTDTYSEEIVVTMFENDLSYFSLLSDTELDIFASAMLNELKELGIEAQDYEIYQHAQTKFIKWSFFDKQNNVYGIQYSTLYNGKAINFTMRSYEGSLSSKQETIIKNIVDEIEFYNDPPVLQEGEDTASFVYTDNDTDVTFTVPDNWKREELAKDREYIDVKFVSTKESSCVIVYGSTDLWGMLTPEEQKWCSRSDYDSSVFGISDIAALYGVDENKITKKTYNGKDYFQATVKQTSNMYDTTFALEVTCAILIEDGWGYYFQFSGTNTHKLYQEFETLLESVQYPNVSNNVSSFFNDNLGIIVIAVLLVVVLIIVISVAISRKKNNDVAKYKQNQQQENIINNENAPVQTSQNTVSQDNNQISFCRKCGQRLIDGSKFCEKCGTEVIKE